MNGWRGPFTVHRLPFTLFLGSEPDRHPPIIERAVEPDWRDLIVRKDAEVVVPCRRSIALTVRVRIDVEHVVHTGRDGEAPIEGVGDIHVGNPFGAERLVQRAVGWRTEAGYLPEVDRGVAGSVDAKLLGRLNLTS